MENEKNQKNKRIVVGVCAVLLLLGLVCGCIFYLNDYYPAGEQAIALIKSETDITIKQIDEDVYAFIPEDPKVGLIFYPGGKVDYEAYAPLMTAFAEKGVLCILPQMPGNLAVLGIDKATGLQDEFPKIDKWYIGGHSLGGAMASRYVYSYRDDFDGLLLLGAYSAIGMSDISLQVISVYGSEDKVMNRTHYEKYKKNLPADMIEHVIEGGCHSYFGDYGMQEGDGAPTITREEQIAETVEFCTDLMLK